MYRVPTDTDPILFGDIFSSDWLVDAFVAQDAVALRQVQMKGGLTGYAPVTPDKSHPSNPFVLAHGVNCQAILLSDDCEIESCLVRRSGRGRLMFAAVTPWPEDSAAAAEALQMTTFRRHPLMPADGFIGGIAELVRLFAVAGAALSGKPGRVLALDAHERARLEQRWAAFATRRGPLAAVDNATKLAHVLDARGNPGKIEFLASGDAIPSGKAVGAAEAVAKALVQGWRTEGEVMERVAEAHEARREATDEISNLEHELRQLSDFASQAADLLRATTESKE
jgi:hypothetical protein